MLTDLKYQNLDAQYTGTADTFEIPGLTVETFEASLPLLANRLANRVNDDQAYRREWFLEQVAATSRDDELEDQTANVNLDFDAGVITLEDATEYLREAWERANGTRQPVYLTPDERMCRAHARLLGIG